MIELRDAIEREMRRLDVGRPTVDAFHQRRERTKRAERRRAIGVGALLATAVIAAVVAAGVGHRHATVTPAGAASVGGTIVYSDRAADGTIHIFTRWADGSHRVDLGAGLSPAFSPDGSRIAFLRDAGEGRFELAVMDANGSNEQDLRAIPPSAVPVRFEMGDAGPTWSPDGDAIAFASPPPGEQQSGLADLYVIGADGANETRLTDDGRSLEPAWSPDGQRIAFVRGGPVDRFAPHSRDDLFVIGRDGSDPHALYTDPDGVDWPSWAPDGSAIVVAGPTSLIRISVDGSARVVADGGTVARQPVWSPDGSEIAFVECSPNGSSCGVSALVVRTGEIRSMFAIDDGSRARLSWRAD